MTVEYKQDERIQIDIKILSEHTGKVIMNKLLHSAYGVSVTNNGLVS